MKTPSLHRWLCAAVLVSALGCSSNGDSPVEPLLNQVGVSPPPRAVLEVPLPFASVMGDMWASPSGAIFAVGDGGNIAVFDNGTWTPMQSGVLHSLRAVWGTSDSNVFAVGGSGCIIRFDGVRWSPVASGFASRLNDITGTVNGPLYATSFDTMLRSDDGGGSWAPVDAVLGINERFNCIEADAQHGVYVGTNKGLYELVNSTLNNVSNVFNVRDIWIAETGDVYFVETGGLQRYTGTNTLLIALGGDLQAIDGVDLDNVYVVGGPFDEARAFELTATGLSNIGQTLPLKRSLRECAVSTDGTLLVSESQSVTATFKNGVWTEFDREDDFSYFDIFGVDDEIFAVSRPNGSSSPQGFFHQYKNGQWLSPLQLSDRAVSVWARAANDVFAVGDAVFHFDGVSVAEVNTGLGNNPNLRAVFGNDNVVYAGGSDALWRFDGTSWSDESDLLRDRVDNLNVTSIWVAPSGEAFVGLSAGMAIVDGSDVRIINAVNAPFFDPDDIFGFSASNAYVVDTSNYQILRWDGNTLTVELVSEDMEGSVWGPAANNVMVAGNEVIHHFNGQGWKTVVTGTRGIANIGGSNTDTFAVGFSERIRIVQ